MHHYLLIASAMVVALAAPASAQGVPNGFASSWGNNLNAFHAETGVSGSARGGTLPGQNSRAASNAFGFGFGSAGTNPYTGNGEVSAGFTAGGQSQSSGRGFTDWGAFGGASADASQLNLSGYRNSFSGY